MRQYLAYPAFEHGFTALSSIHLYEKKELCVVGCAIQYLHSSYVPILTLRA